MSWSKIKNIMISVLVITNVFLLANIFLMRYSSGEIDNTLRESFVSLLDKNGISVEEKLVPKHFEKRKLFNAESYGIDFLSNAFIGKKVKYISQGQSIVAPSDDKSLSLTGEYIEFITLKENVEKSGGDIIKALKNKGIYQKGAYYDNLTGYVMMKQDGIIIEGMYLDAALDKTGDIAYLKGVWPRLSVITADDKVTFITSVMQICEQLPKGSIIQSVEKKYFLTYKDGKYIVKTGWGIHNQAENYNVVM